GAGGEIDRPLAPVLMRRPFRPQLLQPFPGRQRGRAQFDLMNDDGRRDRTGDKDAHGGDGSRPVGRAAQIDLPGRAGRLAALASLAIDRAPDRRQRMALAEAVDHPDQIAIQSGVDPAGRGPQHDARRGERR
ncbi:hypothetical protein RZS08_36150, partial [Arthrospira platensis SPKY1]|nr:hypothetical protein [Arthrospira platensis SPKY1]